MELFVCTGVVLILALLWVSSLCKVIYKGTSVCLRLFLVSFAQSNNNKAYITGLFQAKNRFSVQSYDCNGPL